MTEMRSHRIKKLGYVVTYNYPDSNAPVFKRTIMDDSDLRKTDINYDVLDDTLNRRLRSHILGMTTPGITEPCYYVDVALKHLDNLIFMPFVTLLKAYRQNRVPPMWKKRFDEAITYILSNKN